MPSDFDPATLIPFPTRAFYQTAPDDAGHLDACVAVASNEVEDPEGRAFRAGLTSAVADATPAYWTAEAPMVCLESSWAELAADAELADDLRREFGLRGLALIAKVEASIDELEENLRDASHDLAPYEARATAAKSNKEAA